MKKIKRPQIKLLSEDFSDLQHKTIYDFIGEEGVFAYNHSSLGEFHKLTEIPCNNEDARRWYLAELSHDYSTIRLDFLEVAIYLKNDEFIRQIEKQFDDKIPRYE